MDQNSVWRIMWRLVRPAVGWFGLFLLNGTAAICDARCDHPPSYGWMVISGTLSILCAIRVSWEVELLAKSLKIRVRMKTEE